MQLPPTLKGIHLHVSQWYACQQVSNRQAASKKHTQDELSKPGDPGDNVVQSPNEAPMMETEEPMIFNQDLPADVQSQNLDQPSSSSWCAWVEEVEDYLGDAGRTKLQGQSAGERHRRKTDTNLGCHSRTWRSGHIVQSLLPVTDQAADVTL